MEDVIDSPVSETSSVSISSVVDRSFILLRFTLIIATGYLLIAEFGPRSIPMPLVAMLVVVLLTNVGALMLPAERLRSPWLIGAAVTGDTIWITVALVATGRFTAEFFYLYFFVLFLAGIGENIRLIALSVAVVCLAYLVLIAQTVGFSQVVTTQTLIRVPFLFSVAIFYGYLVDRLRKERSRLLHEQEVIASLERNRRALAEANEELRRQSDVKSKFVSTVSHELKSPLTAINNALSLIQPGSNGDDNEKFLNMIRRNTERLQLIITDLLDMSKVESGSLTIDAKPFELEPFLSEVLETLQPQAIKQGIELRLDLPRDLPTVVGDASRVEQVITNLVSNALKATPAGGSVTLGAVVEGPDSVRITVTDTGIGLSEEDQAKVFEPFFQAATMLEGKPAGTGLGLTICRDLVRGHGGDLEIESALGEGASFSFRLPVLSDRAYEAISFENQVRTTYRAHPYFTILVVDCGSGGMDGETGDERAWFDRVRSRLAGLLPRSLDVLFDQPAHGRVIVVLLSTPLLGGWVVKKKLAAALGAGTGPARHSGAATIRVLGPAGYPEDGDSGFGLIRTALQRGERSEDET